MTLRFYEPKDAQAIQEIFAAQKLETDLPLPDKDRATLFGLVGEEGGRIVLAILMRLTAEAHLVIRPDEPQAARKVRQAVALTEGALMALGNQMEKYGLGAIHDAIAVVPEEMARMQDMMRLLGFREEPEGFRFYYKKLGKV